MTIDVADAASAEFILAGHSNKWALGGYAGPPALVRRELLAGLGISWRRRRRCPAAMSIGRCISTERAAVMLYRLSKEKAETVRRKPKRN